MSKFDLLFSFFLFARINAESSCQVFGASKADVGGSCCVNSLVALGERERARVPAIATENPKSFIQTTIGRSSILDCSGFAKDMNA